MTNTNSARPSRMLLPALALAQFLMVIDSSVMNVSIPTLVHDLDAQVTQIQLAIAVFTLVMASFMMLGGALGDRIGARGAWVGGLVIYGAGSGITAIAHNVPVLVIGWSILEGLGAALLLPTLLSIATSTYRGRELTKALGLIGAVAAGAVAIGPIIGGGVTTNLSWRYVFATEVVLCLLLMPLARVFANPPRSTTRRLDYVGAFLSITGPAAIVFGFLQASTWGIIRPLVPPTINGHTIAPLGLSPTVWLVALGLALLWGMIVWERRVERTGGSPLISPSLFTDPRAAGGSMALLAQTAVQGGVFFTMPLYLGVVLQYEAVDIGWKVLPLSIAVVITALLSPRLSGVWSVRRIQRVGLLVSLLGTLLLATRVSEGLSNIAIPLILLGIGLGLPVAHLTTLIQSAGTSDTSGQVGGMQQAARNLGTSIGTAVVGSLLILMLTNGITTRVSQNPNVSAAISAQVEQQVETGADVVSTPQLKRALSSAGVDDTTSAALVEDYEAARSSSLSNSLLIAAGFILAALLMTGVLPAEPARVD